MGLTKRSRELMIYILYSQGSSVKPVNSAVKPRDRRYKLQKNDTLQNGATAKAKNYPVMVERAKSPSPLTLGILSIVESNRTCDTPPCSDPGRNIPPTPPSLGQEILHTRNSLSFKV